MVAELNFVSTGIIASFSVLIKNKHFVLGKKNAG